MLGKLIVRTSALFCIVFGSVSADQDNSLFENVSGSILKFSINPEQLFVESGKLFYDSEFSGVIPLGIVTYSNGSCHTFLSSNLIQSYSCQGYRCKNCGYYLLKETPGAPGKCPRCQNYDWIIM